MVRIRFPDPEYETAFRAYVNYFEDLAGTIGGLYGITDPWDIEPPTSLAEGVIEAVSKHPPVQRIQRRTLDVSARSALEGALRKAWGALRRAHREIEEDGSYDEEANAWLPIQSYYSVYHAVIALSVASGQMIPRDHAASLKMISKEVRRGLFPYPWSVACEGCPQTGSHSFIGLDLPVGEVHVLSRPDPSTSADRLAMFLRTTRAKELERRFREERNKNRGDGRTRRNVSSAAKEALATKLGSTTLFDILWRLRKKASYDDADVFVLGAAGELDARRLGQALILTTDATVTVVEALVAAYTGRAVVSAMVASYMTRTHSDPASVIGLHAAAWHARNRSPDPSEADPS